MENEQWSGPFLDYDKFHGHAGTKRRNSSLVPQSLNPFTCCFGKTTQIQGGNSATNKSSVYVRRRRRSSTTFNSMVISYCGDARTALRWPNKVPVSNRMGLWLKAAGLQQFSSMDDNPADFTGVDPTFENVFGSPINVNDHCLTKLGLQVASVILQHLRENDWHANGQGQYSLPNESREYCAMIPDLLCCILAFASSPSEAERLLVRMLERSSASPSEFVSGPTMFLAMSKSSMLLYRTVLDDIVQDLSPTLSQAFAKSPIRASELVGKLNWFERLFFGALPYQVATRVVDSFIAEGSKVLFRVAVALLLIHENLITENLRKSRNLQQSMLDDLCKVVKEATYQTSESQLFKTAFGLTLRRKSISAYATKHILAMTTMCSIQQTSSTREGTVPASLFWHPRETDWIGFDLDHTLVVYNENVMTQVTFDAVTTYLAEKKDPRMSKIYGELLERDFSDVSSLASIGVKIDPKRGNVFKLDSHGHVAALFHGTKLATPVELAALAAETDYQQAVECKSFATVNTHFEYMIGPIYALIVAEIDKQAVQDYVNRQTKEDTNDVCYTYDATASDVECRKLYESSFQELKRAFVYVQSRHCPQGFENVLQTQLRQVVPKQPEVERLLMKLRKGCGRKLFLLTNGQLSHTTMLMEHAYGKKWKQLFDLIIVDGGKSKFFDPNNQKLFSHVVDENGTQIVSSSTKSTEIAGKDMRSGHIYSGGSAHELNSFFQSSNQSADTPTVSVMYFGDHLTQDVILPRTVGWQTGSVVSELDHFAWQCSKRLKKAVSANFGALSPSFRPKQQSLLVPKGSTSYKFNKVPRVGGTISESYSNSSSMQGSKSNSISPLPTVPSFATISSSSRSLLSPAPAATFASPLQSLGESVALEPVNGLPASEGSKLSRATTFGAEEFHNHTVNAQYRFMSDAVSLGNPFLAEVSVSPTLLAREIAFNARICIPSLRHLARLNVSKDTFTTQDISSLYLLSPENAQLIGKLHVDHLRDDAVEYFSASSI